MKSWQKDIIPELDDSELVLSGWCARPNNKVIFVIDKYFPQIGDTIYYCHTKYYGRNNALKIAKRFGIFEEVRASFR